MANGTESSEPGQEFVVWGVVQNVIHEVGSLGFRSDLFDRVLQ